MKKLHNIVMIATDKAEDCLYLQSNKLHYHKGYLTQEYLKNSLNAKSFHLYILSDEKIEENNWMYCWASNTIIQAGNNILTNMKSVDFSYYKKIIATSNLILTKKDDEYSKTKNLPQIPKQFIDYYITEYNKGNIITEVEVEYKHLGGTGSGYVLKINKDNTINISISSNKMYSREEVIKFANDWYDKDIFDSYLNELINKNLSNKELKFSDSDTGKNWIKNNL